MLAQRLSGLLEILASARTRTTGSVPDGPDENSASLSQFSVHSLDLGEQLGGSVFVGNRHVLLHLRVARHDGRRLAERSPFERAAEEKRRSEAVAGHVVRR